jgi:2'-5' RNA ligase
MAGGGRFGDRVLWARVDGDLNPLAVGVRRAAERAGYAVEDRPFRAHLTLARGRRNADLRPLAAEIRDVTGPPWDADELVLLRGAQPRSPQAGYERLGAWSLSGTRL